jgi:hypothetical protein
MSIQKRGAATTLYDPLYGRKKEKSVGNKKKGRGWCSFTQDGTAHLSPVHNPPFQKDEAKSFM